MKNWTTFAEVITEMKVATVYMGVSGTRTQVKVQPLTTEPRLCGATQDLWFVTTLLLLQDYIKLFSTFCLSSPWRTPGTRE